MVNSFKKGVGLFGTVTKGTKCFGFINKDKVHYLTWSL